MKEITLYRAGKKLRRYGANDNLQPIFGKAAIVDDSDLDRIVAAGPWLLDSHRRADGVISERVIKYVVLNGKTYQLLMSRFILGIDPLERVSILFNNDNGLDLRQSNLTAVPGGCHIETKKRGSSRYRGVSFCRNAHRWHARITVNKKQISLGYFTLEADAARAYNVAALKVYGNNKRALNNV